MGSKHSQSLLRAVIGGAAAAAAAGGGMAFMRWALQVRTLPERVMEWALIFIPIELFGEAIHRFGFDAKRYGLYGATAGMLAVLAALGAVALARGWSTRQILALALGLWVAVMAIIMPATEAGVFAVALVEGTLPAIGTYLAAALTYAGALVVARAVGSGKGAIDRQASPSSPLRGEPTGALVSRRSALILTGGVLVAYGATFLADLWSPKARYAAVRVIDPQAPLPSGGLRPPPPHPSPGTASSESGRQLVRDKDGAVLPAGRRRGELAGLITSNEDFYVVTKNAVADPSLESTDWRLIIDGDVQRPIELDYDGIRQLPAVELVKTLECISNFVTKCEMVPFGCDLISTAHWRGTRVSDVLALAGGVGPGVVSLATLCADEYTTALPIQAALDPDTLLVYEMNGQPLPREHGYPIRMLVPGRYGMKNAKWVVALRPLRREFGDWYGQRNWSKEGILKTMTRIDVPVAGASLPPGQHRIAGVAYAGDRGVSKVEYSINGGQVWQVADLLEPQAGRDTWVRWQGSFTLAPGSSLTILARATDGTGEVQIEPFSLPEPDGATGWHTCEVRALA